MLLLYQLIPILQESKNSRDWSLFDTITTGSSQVLSQEINLRLILVDFLFQLPLILTCFLVSECLSGATDLFIVFHFFMMNCELVILGTIGRFLYWGYCSLEMTLGLEIWSRYFIGSAVDVDLGHCFVSHSINFISFRKRPKIKIICFWHTFYD